MSNIPSAQPTGGSHLVPGNLLYSKSSTYLVQSILGEGSFGIVAKCRTRDNKKVAVKMIKKEKSCQTQVMREVSGSHCMESPPPYAQGLIK